MATECRPNGHPIISSFKRAFAKRRCLIPADGYYEWMKTDDVQRRKTSIAIRITRHDFTYVSWQYGQPRKRQRNASYERHGNWFVKQQDSHRDL